MKISPDSFILLVLCSAAPLGAADRSADFQPPSYHPGPALHGTLSTAGTVEMGPMVEAWAALMQRTHPGVTVAIAAKGPPAAAAGLTDGTAQIGFLGRTIKGPELAALIARQGHPPRRIRVAGGAHADKAKTSTMAVFVRRDNPLRQLTLLQLDALLSATRRRGHPAAITTWGQLGLTGEWVEKPVRVYTGQLGQGRLNFVSEAVLLDGAWTPAARQFPHDDDVAAAVAADPGGIGVAALAYEIPGVACVALGAGDGGAFHAPTRENVAAGRYPLSREVYLYISATPGRPVDPLIREFLHIALSREGQEAALAAGFLPLPVATASEELRKIEQ